MKLYVGTPFIQLKARRQLPPLPQCQVHPCFLQYREVHTYLLKATASEFRFCKANSHRLQQLQPIYSPFHTHTHKNTHDSTVSLQKQSTMVLLLKNSCQRSPCEALLGDYEIKTTIAFTIPTCVLVQGNWLIATCEVQALSCPCCHQAKPHPLGGYCMHHMPSWGQNT